jgi:hypothetical protein
LVSSNAIAPSLVTLIYGSQPLSLFVWFNELLNYSKQLLFGKTKDVLSGLNAFIPSS